MTIWDYVQAIVIICAVILAAYYVTKLVAKTGSGQRRGTGIKQVASMSLGRDKSVTIVEIGDTAYILGVGPQRIELIDKKNRDELVLDKDERPQSAVTFATSFRDELNKRLKK